MNRHLTVAAVDEHGEFDFGGATIIGESAEGGQNGAPGEKHVVHQDDVGPLDSEGDVALLEGGIGVEVREIVTIEGNIEHAEGKIAVLFGEEVEEALSNFIAAASDTHQGEWFALGFLADGEGESFHS